MSSKTRLKLAQIALGDGAIKDLGFYSSLHQEELEDKYQKHKQENTYSLDLPDFSGSQWDLIRAGSHDQQEISSTPASLCSVEDTCNKIDEVMLNLKKQLRQQPLMNN